MALDLHNSEVSYSTKENEYGKVIKEFIKTEKMADVELMQSIGINLWGRELYEGDILKVVATKLWGIERDKTYIYLDVTGVVTRNAIGTMIGDVQLLRAFDAEEVREMPAIEYLGNKFENPELLEEIERTMKQGSN
ncbi:TPA: YopX family protein [Staphylococcus aureus]|uniref:YopX family protein n=1 Tax=Staphylococcus aureus TaxID=1280 RepID=A0AAW4Y9Q3_STAAU|nr:YopX family protein [Staphylococcus aureus]MCE3362891.1 YopX family protein [Staphylococcus aureus]MCK8534431.1 YopX family protein [Staphylococcus aureus]